MRSEYSETELETLAQAAYTRRPLRCPRCEARVRYSELGVLGRSTVPLSIRCPRCQTHGQYSPDHLEAMDLEWTREEKLLIIERYWSSGRVRCPSDDSVLKTQESKSIGTSSDIYFRCPYCGRTFHSASVDSQADPETFDGQYEEIELLGEGGMGSVHLVREKSNKRLWAAKKIRPEILSNETAVRRFQRESRILEAIKHPNIVAIHDTFLDDRGSVIVMDYVDGYTLKEAINDHDIPLTDLAEYFGQLADGLSYLHSQGVIHRDLKPENVLVHAKHKVAQISDFGLARLVDRDTTTLTRLDAFLGTHQYAAPEQRDNSKDVTKKCDVYAAGLIAYEILTRNSPFHMIDMSSLSAPIRKPLKSCLSRKPGDRPGDPEELAEKMRAYAMNSAE